MIIAKSVAQRVKVLQGTGSDVSFSLCLIEEIINVFELLTLQDPLSMCNDVTHLPCAMM